MVAGVQLVRRCLILEAEYFMREFYNTFVQNICRQAITCPPFAAAILIASPEV